MSVVFNETESAGRLVESIQTHNQPLDLSALGKKLVNLLFSGVEGPVQAYELLLT